MDVNKILMEYFGTTDEEEMVAKMIDRISEGGTLTMHQTHHRVIDKICDVMNGDFDHTFKEYAEMEEAGTLENMFEGTEEEARSFLMTILDAVTN